MHPGWNNRNPQCGLVIVLADHSFANIQEPFKNFDSVNGIGSLFANTHSFGMPLHTENRQRFVLNCLDVLIIPVGGCQQIFSQSVDCLMMRTVY